MAEPERARELIDRYLNGQADHDELRALSGMLEEDAAVADALLAAAQIDTVVEQYFQNEPCREELRQTLERFGRRRRPAVWLVAASVLFALGGVAWWQLRPEGGVDYDVLSGQVLVQGQSTGRVVEGASVTVLGETPAVIRLTDGLQVELEPESEAIMHGRQGTTRQVVELLHGSGVFRVPKGEQAFRLDTAVAGLTCSDTEFSVDYVNMKVEENTQAGYGLQAATPAIAALVVSVATGSVQVDVQSQKFTLYKGESRVFAAAPNDGFDQKKINAPLPSGDLLGFEINGKTLPLEKSFPGITAALLLTEDQKRQIYRGQLETVQSEAVRNAGATLKSDPALKAKQRAQAEQVISRARQELLAKVDSILTGDQRSLVKRLSGTAAKAQLAVSEKFRDERIAAKGNQAKSDEVQRRMREPLVTEFRSLAAEFLSPEQLAAFEKTNAAQKAAEERAKYDPKNLKVKKP